jgi:hypothetical protein
VGNAHIRQSTDRGKSKQQLHSVRKLKLAASNAILKPGQDVNLLVAIFEAFLSLAVQRDKGR